jgi:branched-chain amino acid transport system substrate-binding protein
MTRPPARSAVALTLMLVAALAVLTGCGGSAAPAADRIDGTALTIYSSAPLEGGSAAAGRAIVNGERLALSQMHDRIGRYRISLVALDDATAKRGSWDPGQTTLNARLAAANPNTIGYIGEVDSGASAISIPVLNRAGIPQISAASTAVGLTSSGPGASPGEPGKYYPSGVRTFVRVTPNDLVQAAAQVRLQQSVGCNKTFVLDDGAVDGSDAATTFQLSATSDHLGLAGQQSFDPTATDYTALARSVAQTGADCVLISAAADNSAVLVTEQMAQALPSALLFATAGLADRSYVAEIPRSLDGRLTITAAPPGDRAFLAGYARRFGRAAPDAVLGYEAMSLMLDAIARTTHRGTRRAVRARILHALFATRNHAGAIGTYSINSGGDTTLRTFGVYGVSGGRLQFLRAIRT